MAKNEIQEKIGEWHDTLRKQLQRRTAGLEDSNKQRVAYALDRFRTPRTLQTECSKRSSESLPVIFFHLSCHPLVNYQAYSQLFD